MGQGITIDVQAKIVGYEAGIKQMQQALQKIDPGSELSQKITKALASAQKEVQSLGKNMFPKASTDAQVDAVVEKVNRIGSALQNVSAMFQGLTMGDLNFNALGSEFQNIQSSINSLSSSMDNKLNQGLVDAVSNSNQLKSIFTELGTDMSKATADSLFEDLAKGAKQAAEEATKAETAYKNATEAVNKKNKALIDAQNSPIGTEAKQASIKAEVDNLTRQYNDVMSSLRNQMSEGLMSKLQGSSLDPAVFLDNFFAGLTPETIGNKINALFESLSKNNIYGAGGEKNFYKEIFGLDTLNLSDVINSINLEGQIQPIADRMRAILGSLGDTLKEKDAWNIRDLLDSNDIDGALSALKGKLGDAIDQTKRRIKTLSQALEDLQAKQKAAKEAYAGKEGKSKEYDAARSELNRERDALEKQQREAQRQLEEQNAAARRIAMAELQRAQAQGVRGGQIAGSSKFPISEANQYKDAITQIQNREQMLGKAQGLVQRYFSLYAAVRMVSKGFRSMMSTIKELDSTITDIAIVTNKTQPELWDQMPQYTKLAREYASSISGVYKVSQLYYQQGLGQSDVMALTEQTLKMARISGLDYAQATDYMTNAVRSFKMEMTDAQTVVDTYSAVAAKSATSVSELATAMSKTASSAQSVGADIQTTTAMMAVMIEATRESPENIGSAMKSIISRYGELKENITGMDEEGEEYSLNKVDKALQSVGISIHDANGEFRDFDDVIMELADSWDTIDKNTQRYIATVMAGNRQQSRFLALVSSGSRLRELVGEATESEDAAQLQFLKTLDSIDAKTQQLQTSIQSLYVNSGLEETYKTALDYANQIVSSFDSLAQNNGLETAMTKMGTMFSSAALVVSNLFNSIKTRYANMRTEMLARSKIAAEEEIQQARIAELTKQGCAEESAKVQTDTTIVESRKRQEVYQAEAKGAAKAKTMSGKTKLGLGLTAAGLAATTIAASMETTEENRKAKSILTGAGGLLSGGGTMAMIGGPAGVIMGLVTAIPSLIEAVGMWSESTTERIDRLTKDVTDTNNERIKSKSELKTLEDYKEKYDELSKSQYESVEKQKEFKKLNNEIAEAYPELISRMDEEGNYIVDMATGYERLAEAKRKAYKTDITEQAGAELAGLNDIGYVLKNVYKFDPLQSKKTVIGSETDKYGALGDIDYSQERSVYEDSVKQLFRDGNTNIGTISRLFKNSDAYLKLYASAANSYTEKFEDNTVPDRIAEMYLDVMDYVGQEISPAEAVSKVKAKQGHMYDDLLDTFDFSLFDQARTQIKAKDYQQDLIEDKMSAYNSEIINLLSDNAESAWGLESTAIQKRFAQKQLQDEWNSFYKENEGRIGKDWNYEENREYNYGDLVKDFYASHDEFWYKQQRESELIAGLTKEMNDFYQDMGAHTEDEIDNLFPDTKILSDTEAQIVEQQKSWFKQIFENNYKDILSNYNSWINDTAAKSFKVHDYSKTFGPEFLSQVQQSYMDILNNDSLADSIKQNQINKLNAIYDLVGDKSKFTSKQQGTILGKITAGDLTSVKGIYDLVKSLSSEEGLDIDSTGLSEALFNLKDTLSVNIDAELQAYVESYSKSISNMEKDISSATKGMDFESAFTMASKLGKTISDFRYESGKYYLDSVEDIEAFYNTQNQKYLDDLRAETDEKRTELSGKFDFTKKSGEKLRTLDADYVRSVLLGNKEATEKQYYDYMENFREELAEQGVDIDQLWNSRKLVDASIPSENIYAQRMTYDTELANKLYNLDKNASEVLSLGIDEIFANADNDITKINKALDNIDWSQAQSITKDEVSSLAQRWTERTGEDLQLSFTDWVNKYYDGLWDSTLQETQRYTKDQTAKALLSNGRIEDFVKYTAKDQLREQVEEEFKDQLWPEITEADVKKALAEEGKTTSASSLATEIDGFKQARSEINKQLDQVIAEDEANWAQIDPDEVKRELEEQGKSNTKENFEETAREIASRESRMAKDVSEAQINAMIDEAKAAAGDTWTDAEYLETEARLRRAAKEHNDKIIEDEVNKRIEQLTSEAASSIKSGDFSYFTGGNAQFEAIARKLYTDTWTSITNSMTEAISGGTEQIEITDINKEALSQLADQGFFDTEEINKKSKNGELITGATLTWKDLVDKSESEIASLISTLELPDKTKNSILQSFHDAMHPDDLSKLTSLISEDSFDYSTLHSYFDAFAETANVAENLNDYGLALNEATGKYDIKDYATYFAKLREDLNDLDLDTNSDEYRDALADLDAAERSYKNKDVTAQIKSFSDVISNYSKVTDDQITALQKSLSIDQWQEIAGYFTDLGTGEYKLDVGGLKSHLSQLGLSKKVQEAILGMFDSIADDYLKNITTATSMVTQGTTNQADIQKFIAGAKQLGVDAEGAFSYDSILNAWTLNAATMGKYVQAQAQQLVDDGLLSANEVNDYVNKNVTQALANAIDIKAYLDSENRGSAEKSSQSRDALKKQLMNANIWMGDQGPYNESWVDYLNDDLKAQWQAGQDIDLHSKEIAKQYAEHFKQVNDNIREEAANQLINSLDAGGIEAVQAMQAVADLQHKELTAADIESAYHSQVSQIEKASDQLTSSIGSLISGDAVTILEKAGYGIEKIAGTNSAVISSIGDISTAYVNYYGALKKSNEATLEQLNNAYAKVLETKQGRDKEQSAIDALGSATGMTFETLGAIFTEAGMSLEDNIKLLQDSGIIEAIGGNKLRIKDFAAFARGMHWDLTSEEAVSAFKTYNDSMIELNHKAEKNIVNEVKALESAQAGDWINLTQFTDAYQKAFAQIVDPKAIQKQAEEITGGGYGTQQLFTEMLQEVEDFNKSIIPELSKELFAFGGILEDGILQLQDNADRLGLYSVLNNAIQKMQSTGQYNFGKGADEIQDTFNSMTKSYIDKVSSGLEGSLSHVDAAELQQLAKNSLLGSQTGLQFKETAEGLQLTEDSFFSLYGILSKTNKLMAKKLLPDMQKMSGKYGNLGDAVDAFEKSLKKGQGSNTDEQNTLYDLLRDMFTNPDNYNLMDYDLPTTYQAADNYYSSQLKAYQASRDIMSGSIGLGDYANLAQSLMHSGNKAAGQRGLELLQYGMDYYQKDANGNSIIDTKRMYNDLKKKGIIGKEYSSYSQWADSFYQDWKNAYSKIGDIAYEQQEAYNTLFYGGASLRFADVWDDNNEISEEKLSKLLSQDTEQAKNIKGLLDSFTYEGESLADLAKGKRLGGLKDVVSRIANTEWDWSNVNDQLTDVFKGTGKGATVTYDSEGKIKVEINDKTGVEIVHKTKDGKEFKNDQYSEYLQNVVLQNKIADDQNIKWEDFNEEGLKGFKTTYELDGNSITVKFLEDYTTVYEAKGKDGRTYTADSYSGMMAALSVGQNLDTSAVAGEQPKTSKITMELESGTLEIEYHIENGEVKIDSDNQDNPIVQQVRERLQEMVDTGLSETGLDVRDGIKAAFTGETGEQIGAELGKNLGASLIQGVAEGVSEDTGAAIGTAFNDALGKAIGDKVDSGEITSKFTEALTQVITDGVTVGGEGQSVPIKAGEITVQPSNVKLDTTGSNTLASDIQTMLGNADPVPVTVKPVPDGVNPFEGQVFDVKVHMTPDSNEIEVPQSESQPASTPTPQKKEAETKVKQGAVADVEITFEPAAEDDFTRKTGEVVKNAVDKASSEAGAADISFEPQVDQQSMNSVEKEIHQYDGGTDVPLNLVQGDDDTSRIIDKMTPDQLEVPMNGKVTSIDVSGIDPPEIEVKAVATASEDVPEPSSGEGVTQTMNYVIGDVAELGEQTEEGTVNWDNNYGGPPAVADITRHVHWINDGVTGAKGTVGNIIGRAHAKSTLMGELGPEMVVSDNRYYIVGQDGPEFVDLENDAIVFNHLQTRQLLKHGHTPTHGKAVTNEYEAAGMAHASAKPTKITLTNNDTKGSNNNSTTNPTSNKITQPNIVIVNPNYADAITKAINGQNKQLTDRYNEAVTRSYDVQTQLNNKNLTDKERAVLEHQAEVFNNEIKTLGSRMPQQTGTSNVIEASDQLIQSSNNLNTAARNMGNAAGNMNNAADNIDHSAENLNAAAGPGQRNEWASQQDPRGGLTSPNNLIHPNAARTFEGPTAGGGGGGGGRVSYNYRGNGTLHGNTFYQQGDSPLATFINSKSGGGGGGADETSIKEVKSAVSTFISDLLSKGAQAINLDDYEKMDAGVKSEIAAKITNGDNYRTFIDRYAGYLDKGMKDVNTWYFQAWQKDLSQVGMGEAEMEALEGLSFYANGEIGGSADDWTEILGDAAYVGDAVQAGIFEWNAALRQYIVRDQEAMEQFMNTKLGNIWNFPDVAIDQAESVVEEIDDLLTKSISDGGISSKDKTRLEELLKKQGYTGSLDFVTSGKNKYLLSSDSVIEVTKGLHTFTNAVATSAASTLGDIGEEVTVESDINEELAPIYDAIYDRIKNSVDYIKNLIEGTSSFEDFQSLKDNLLTLDLGIYKDEINKNLQYEETENGLQLKQSSLDWLIKVLSKDYPERVEELIKTANETYFKNWEDDMEKASKDAMKQMKYYSGGGMSGSSSDWSNLLGGQMKVSDLVALGILTYNEKLDTYVASSIEEIKKLGLNPDILDESVIKDGIDQLFEEILSNFSKAMSEGLSNVEMNQFIENLHLFGVDLNLTFKQTVDGLKLASESAIELYFALQKVDSIQAQLYFKKLNESLKESNDHYKNATTILAHIKELQDKINDAEHYSDEKIKQYKEELTLAKEILAVRTTSEDDSFDVANRELPAGMKNALTYANSIATIAHEFREAFETEEGSGIIDYQMFYNMATEINNAAAYLGTSIDFFGYTLDGGIDGLDNVITHAANSLGSSVDGSKIGVSLEKFGEDIVGGMDDFASSADTAMHTMAKVQIEILDGLIAMFEVIVAMEEFEGVDTDKNGLLDLNEIFDLTGLSEEAQKTATKFNKEFSDAASNILAAINSDEKWKKVADSIKLNGHTITELLEAGVKGTLDLVDVTAEEYQKMLSVIYEKFKSGDFDINDIYNSLKENFMINDSNWDGTIEINDIVLNVKYGVQLTKTEEGYVTPGGATYPDTKSAAQGLALEAIGGTDVTFDPITVTSSGTLHIGESNIEVTVSTDESEAVTYNAPSGTYTKLNDAIKGEWQAARDRGETTLDLKEWEIDQKIKVIPVVSPKLAESDLQLDQSQINAAIGKTYEEIEAEWNAAKGNKEAELKFQATYGIAFNDQTTEEDWARFKELAGITTQNIELNASINLVNSDPTITQLLSGNAENHQTAINVSAVVDAAQQAMNTLKTDINNTQGVVTVNVDTSAAQQETDALKNYINSTYGTVQVDASTSAAQDKLDSILEAIDKIDTSIDIDVNINQNGEFPSASGSTSAKGNVAGLAMASGTQTLMGELGPELYVSNGRYHLVGEAGAEFVNLPDDAIVFNHLQTERLLASGSAGRGKPVTNEQNAVAMARGTTGPAAANARETLAALKQMKAMWQSIANMSVTELAGHATDNGKENIATWFQQLEKWFTLMQKIATLEKEITREQKIRAAFQSKLVAQGDKYADSLVRSVRQLTEELDLQQQLAESHLQEYNKLRSEINSDSPFNKFFTFDEKGQIVYTENKANKELFLKILNTQYETNELATKMPQQQVKWAEEAGLGRYMKTDSEGKDIVQEEGESDSEFAARKLDALKYSMDTMQGKIQGEYDAWFESINNALDLEAERNKILQEIRDNQLSLEEKILTSIEEREQAIIDKLTDERTALSNASEKYIKGLEDTLSKERKLYEKNNETKELETLQRRLSILQRSGGPQSEIANLQEEIQEKSQDLYFDTQQEQIDAVREASDLQLEKLQTQIDLMTETLEYSKEHGLLWAEVNEVLKGTSEEITSFITGNMKDWQSKSTLAQEEEQKEILFIAQEFNQLKEYGDELSQNMTDAVTDKLDEVLTATEIVIEKQETKTETEEKVEPVSTTISSHANIGESTSNKNSVVTYDTLSKTTKNLKALKEKWISINQQLNDLDKEINDLQFKKQTGRISSADKALLNTRLAKKLELEKERNTLKETLGYIHGGMVTETGLVQVHGTKSRPEAFINADEVQMWKQEILGNSSHSLLGQMLEIRSLYDSISGVSDSITHNTDSIIIEHAEVNMNVEQLANDYDARRAGEVALEEMVRIARKQGMNNVRR